MQNDGINEPGMRKQRFKIICYRDGDNSLYDTRIKTWLGWISFSVFYKTQILHVVKDPIDQKSLAYERIYNYCQEKGYKKSEVVITERNENRKLSSRLLKRLSINKIISAL